MICYIGHSKLNNDGSTYCPLLQRLRAMDGPPLFDMQAQAAYGL